MNQDKKTREANIAPGSDMNNGIPKDPPPPDIPDFLPMGDDLFEDLPIHLRQACEKLSDDEERETFLIGALGVISGMLPNVQGLYMERTLGPNLYCFVMGRYGTGKGALMWAHELGRAVDDYRTKQAAEAIAKHNEEEAAYNRQMALYNKGKLPSPPEAPKPPRHLKLYLPANSTKTAVMQLLMENNGSGVIFETEGDTLADMLRQDYGNFSDVLRKAYHHEPVSYYRRANNEDVKLERPALSVVLSGTQDQLRRLIPSIENGLFSRFCFYILQRNAAFKNPFDKKNSGQEGYFHLLSAEFLRLYRRLERQDMPVHFELSPQQERAFFDKFQQQKQEIQENIGDELDGTVNRMGVICFRIAMILTMVRNINHDRPRYICADADFDTAMTITEHLVHYSLYIYELLQYHASHTPATVENKSELIDEVCRCHQAGFSIRRIADEVFGDEKRTTTIFRWIKKFCA